MCLISRRVCCFLLLWGLTGAAARMTTESPLRDSIVQAQDNFLNAQGTIIRMHAGEVIAGSLVELKSRLSILQSEIEKLIQSSNSRSAESDSCISAMNNLTISYTAIESRLGGLQMEFEKHNVFESRTILFRDIIADIRHHRYLLADEKFFQLGDMSSVRKVVHEVYAHSEDNLRIVLNFSTIVSDSARCFAVLESLIEEISTSSNENKVLSLIRLAHIIEKEGLNCNSSDRTLRLDLIRKIEIVAADFFIISMKSGNFSSNESVRVLLDALYDFCPKVFDAVMKRLIDGVYGIVDPQVVLANIFIRGNTVQAISGIGNLFWKINEIDGLFNHSSLIIDIASNLSVLRNRLDFGFLNNEIKTFFNKVVESIPKCARNLFFEESVCLWNKAKNVYLQAVDEKFNYDVERRQVLAAASTGASEGGIPQGAAWLPMRQGDDILFRSRDYLNEFLYYANFEYNNEMRFVFSWIKGNNRDNQSAFKIQLLDDGSCYLKSTRYNEYMFASDVKFEKDDSYSYVFAFRAGSAGGLDSPFAWEVKAC